MCVKPRAKPSEEWGWVGFLAVHQKTARWGRASGGAQARVLKDCSPVSGCILSEDKVARRFRVAGETGFERGLGARFTIFVEVSEPPPTGGAKFLCILHH